MQAVLLRKLLCLSGYAVAFFFITDAARDWQNSSHITLYSSYGLGVVALGSMAQLMFVRCPRCRGWFHGRPLRSNFFRFRCKSCRFPREAPVDE